MKQIKKTIYCLNLRKKLQELDNEIFKLTLEEVKKENERRFNKRSK